MIIDAHVHRSGAERSGDVLRSRDEAQVDFAVLLAPFLSDGYSLDDGASQRLAQPRPDPRRIGTVAGNGKLVNGALPAAAKSALA